MKNEAQQVIDWVLPGLETALKNSKQHGLDQVHISTGRTTEMISFLRNLKLATKIVTVAAVLVSVCGCSSCARPGAGGPAGPIDLSKKPEVIP